MSETPVWFDNLVYRIKDTSARVFCGRSYQERICKRCGLARYNHTHGNIRIHPPAPGTDPEYDAGMAEIRALFDGINDRIVAAGATATPEDEAT